MWQKIKLFFVHAWLSSTCQKHELVIRSAVNEVPLFSVEIIPNFLVVDVVTLLSIDAEKRKILGRSDFGRMERVLENVFVIFDAVEDHLVEENFAVWKGVGSSDGQGTRRRESGVEKD